MASIIVLMDSFWMVHICNMQPAMATAPISPIESAKGTNSFSVNTAKFFGNTGTLYDENKDNSSQCTSALILQPYVVL